MKKYKEIENYEGVYWVCDDGSIKSKKRILKASINDQGYKVVSLCRNGNKKSFNVHRLVAIAFIENYNDLKEVNHINEIKSDNRSVNIEWMTRKQNANHGTAIERNSRKQTKKVLQYDKKGNFIKEWDSMRELKKEGFSQPHICSVCLGKRKSHKGYIWKYEH